MKKIVLASALGLAGAILIPSAASAQTAQSVQANLSSQNESGATGTVTATLTGTTLAVSIRAQGLAPGEAPHAQHIHGNIGGASTCPDMSADANGDGFLTTTEGQPAYGPILVSLTTEGDSTPESALAVDRMPTGDANGNLSYERTLEVPQEVADNIQELHVVQHGIDPDGSGMYDGDRMSELDPALPAEATDPTDCGELQALPAGGVQTGGGGTANSGSTDALPGAMLAFGAAGVVVAGGGVMALRRAIR